MSRPWSVVSVARESKTYPPQRDSCSGNCGSAADFDGST